jgi:hypothetical protein
MLRVYLITSDVIPLPLTVIAEDDGAASRMFGEWAGHHHPGELLENVEIKLLSATDQALQPQLEAARAQGMAGLAYWAGHRLGYLVAAPQEPRFGALAPHEPDVRCYAVDDEAEEVLVLARTREQAVALFTEWNLIAYGDRGESATVKEMSPWLLRGPQVTLREDMDEGLTGVGSVCEDGFWRIFPADYEPTIGR